MAAVTTMNGYSLLGVPLSIIAAGGRSTQVRTGDVATILEYVAQRFDAEVEPLVTFHGWRSVTTNEAVGGHPRSNHPSGTALDLNGYKHPYRATTTGFTAAQVVALRRILADVAPVVRWGGDFPAALRDGMHFEIVGTRAQVAEVAARIARPAPITKPSPTTAAPDIAGDDEMALTPEGLAQIRTVVAETVLALWREQEVRNILTAAATSGAADAGLKLWREPEIRNVIAAGAEQAILAHPVTASGSTVSAAVIADELAKRLAS